jgi:NitT/TauT family transport system substrate-binding protein
MYAILRQNRPKRTHSGGTNTMPTTVSRRALNLALALTVTATLLPAASALAADPVKVGVLRFISSGGLFLAKEKGYFTAEGIDAELVFFEAAQPIAVAVASGDVGFGVTAITGGTLNLAGKGALKMVASQGAERKGFKGNAIIVSNEAYAKGITSLDKLAGSSVAITQIGSSHHYMMGQIAAAQKFDLSKVTLKPLQGIPNMLAALKTNQVDAALTPPQFAKPMLDKGEAKLLAYFSDVADYQYGAMFASPKLVTDKADLVTRFVRAYQKGNAEYVKAFLRMDAKGEAAVDDETKAAASLIAKHIYPNDAVEVAVPKLTASAVYVDASAKLDPAEIDRQIAWYKAEKLVGDTVDSKAFVDTSFAK